MTERNQPPEPVSDLEQEGIPDVQGAFPGEAATGVSWDGMVAPGDEPRGAEEFGVTSEEERLQEPLAMRVRREIPDDADEEGEVTAEDLAAGGRLVEPHEGAPADEEGDLVGSMAAYDPGGYSAEEAAVQVTDEDGAAGLSWDGSPDYVGDEAPGGGAHEATGR